MRAIEQILEQSRWAPSGDNTQPWRFEIVDDRRLRVHAFDTREHCVYDLDGHPSQIAHGALLETLSIAASGHGLRTAIQRHAEAPESQPVYDVTLIAERGVSPDPLLPYIAQRTVQRRPMRTRTLSQDEKHTLRDALGEEYDVQWFESLPARARMAKLMFDNAKLRLTLPEAYPVHRDIIEWNARFSEDRVPDQALGLDAMTLKLMRQVMASWERVAFFNRYLAGHLTPRIEMDLLPGLFCAAHFAIRASRPPVGIDDYVAAGRAVQRFWLTATRLGLQLQPEMTPLIFGRYVRTGRTFSAHEPSLALAGKLAGRMMQLFPGGAAECNVFLGRIGHARPAASRSLRRPLHHLST